MTSTVSWEQHRAAVKDDQSIREEFVALFAFIVQHVETYYVAQPTESAPADYFCLLADVVDEDLMYQFDHSDDVRPLLCRIVASWLIARISLRCSLKYSLLPASYSLLPGELSWHMESKNRENSAAAEARPGQIAQTMPGVILTKKGFLSALADWRMAISWLHTDEKPIFKMTVDRRQAAIWLLEAMSWWTKVGQDSRKKDEDFDQLMKCAAAIGRMLFERRGTFRFDWSTSTTTKDDLLMFPALLKVADANGQSVLPPAVLLPSETRKLRLN